MEEKNTDEQNEKKRKVIEEFEKSEPKLPMIEHPRNSRLITDFIEECAKIIKPKKIMFFQKDSHEIVQLLDNKNNIILSKIESPTLVSLLEKYMTPYVYDSKNDKKHPKTLTDSNSKLILASNLMKELLDPIEKIIDVPLPIIYNNKLTFMKHGYDERFKSWIPPNSPKISNPNMTLQEASKIFDDLLGDFCFTEKQDRVNAIAGFITPFLKGLSKREDKIYDFKSPLWIYQANRERAGKDCLAGITGMLYEGIVRVEDPISATSEEELSKKIVASLLAGKKIYHSANNRGELINAVFESATTSSVFSGRKLGKSEQLSLDNYMEYSISANIGFIYTPDIENRSRKIGLFLAMENPNSRTFKHINLHEWVLENRENILSAIYTLIRIWDEKGRPKGTLPFASFPEWAEICGGVMESCNLGNPCVLYKREDVGGDDETKDMKTVFETMYETFGNKYVLISDIVDKMIELKVDAFIEINFHDAIKKRDFSRKITKYIGRELSGIRLVVESKDTQTKRRKHRFEKI